MNTTVRTELERDPESDYGDDLTSEQKAAITTDEPALTDDEVNAAVKAMTTKDGSDPDVDPDVDSDPETKTEPKVKAKSKDTKPTETETESESEPETKDTHLIPQSRFDEAVNNERTKAKKAEQRANDLQRQLDAQKAPVTNAGPTLEQEIDTAAKTVRKYRSDWQAAMLDNDKAKADQFLEAMNDAEDALTQLRLEHVSQNTRVQATEDITFEEQLTFLEKTYPQINQNVDVYDAEIDRKVYRLMTGLINAGVSRVEALKEAADVYLQPLNVPTEPVVNKKDETEETLRTKAKQTLKQSLDTQAPIVEGKVDTKIPPLKISRLTDKQFAAIPEEQLAILRGDVL